MIVISEPTPLTLADAVERIVSQLDVHDLKYIAANAAASVHHSMGRHMRNQWGLWRDDSPLNQYFRSTYGLGHADDMSGIIMNGVWARALNEVYDIAADVEKYKAHWRAMKIDPLTQEQLP